MGTFIRNIRPLGASTSNINLRFEDDRMASLPTPDARPQTGDIEIDGRERLAISGLINAHTHLDLSHLKGKTYMSAISLQGGDLVKVASPKDRSSLYGGFNKSTRFKPVKHLKLFQRDSFSL